MPSGSSSTYNRQPTYRAFHLDADGHVLRAVIIDALNDSDAVELAHKLVAGHAIELWDRERVIGKFAADGTWLPSLHQHHGIHLLPDRRGVAGKTFLHDCETGTFIDKKPLSTRGS